MKKACLLFITASVILVSCVQTSPQLKGTSLQELSIEKIEEDISDKNFALVLQGISSLSRRGTDEEKSFVPELGIKALELINLTFSEYVENKDFASAASLFLTAESGGLEIDGDWTYQDLISSVIFSEDSGYTDSRKIYIARNKLDISLLPDSELKELLEISAGVGDIFFSQKLIHESDKRSLTVETPGIPINSSIAKSDYLKGTVTILVNRGMKIEGGIGMPDRVIGSGFFIDKAGYILTNYHVIDSEVDPEFEGFSRLYIRLWNDQNLKIPARVVGWDKTFDIALLKVELEPEFIFSFSEGKDYLPGTSIIAIGSPGGLENTITSGIISATGRKFLQMGTVIQVDVPINHGNSGGPLIDSEGELAGVVFAGIEQFEGINFAIPGEYLVPLIPALYSGGRVKHPFLGAAVEEVDAGLRIIYRFPGRNIELAGLETDDIITSINGKEVKSIDDINRLLLNFEPGMAVSAEWLSKGEKRSGVLALGERPDFPLYDILEADLKKNLIPPVFGMRVNNISENIFGNEYIVTEVFPGTIADETGLSVNDPFSIKKWKIMDDEKALIMQIRIKKRKAGFLESGVQLGAYLGTSNVI